MKIIKKLALVLTLIAPFSGNVNAQVCIPTYTTVCFSGGGGTTFDVIDNFWTEGGITNISNLDSDCSLLPDNYDLTGMAVTACAGESITTNVQCEVGTFTQGFAIWVDWNKNDVFEAAEKVFSSPTAGDFVHTGSFTIPGTAPIGEVYNMRVRSNFAVGGAGINPCDSQTYGETEDYLVIVGSCSPTICQGDSTEIDLGTVPPGVTGYSWSPATDISDPFAGPIVEVWPDVTTTYTATITSIDSVWTVPIEVIVVEQANPFAGLDDTICFDPLSPYDFAGTIDVSEDDVTLEWDIAEFFGTGSPLTVYTPGADVLASSIQVSISGDYDFELTVIDNFGICPDQSDTVRITFSEALHDLASTNPLCFGAADGTITVTGTGTLDAAEYSIDGGVTWQVSNVFTDLPSGTYSVMSRDIFGCEFTSDIELIDPDEVTIVVSADTTICQNGTAILNATGGGGVAFTYDWSILGSDDSGTQSFSPTTTTMVTVTAFNEFGCPSTTETINVTVRSPLTLTITENDSICPGFLTESSVIPNGGDGTYTYSWTANGAPLPDVGAMISANPTEETIYCVTVSDGCETTPVEICNRTVMRPVPIPVFTSDLTVACNPSIITFEAAALSTDTLIWTLGGRVIEGSSIIEVEFDGVGFYDVQLEVINEFGCSNTLLAEDYIEIVDIPHPAFFINPNPTTIFNTEVTLNSSASEPGDTFEWSTIGGAPSSSTEESPSVVYPDGVPGNYPVELTVTNIHGCTNTVSSFVNILSDVIIYAPNAFTPDGDEFNEGWRVYMEGIDVFDFHCVVFNRYGEIVWESFNVEGIWNGTYGDGSIVQDGTYVWVVDAKEATNDRRIEFRGTVHVLK